MSWLFISTMTAHVEGVLHTEISWHKSVYRKSKAMTRDEKENWKKTRRFILDRDRQTCQRCDKHFRAQRDLSVHHIVPRADGGSDDPSNLVTLCQSCHDYAEMNGLKTLAEIIGSFEDKTVEVYKKADEQIETFARPDWHAWVYGGARNPQLDEMKERK